MPLMLIIKVHGIERHQQLKKKETDYKKILKSFFNIYNYPDITVIAVGREAERACKNIKIKCEYVRHPSKGGKNKFKEQLKRICSA